MYALNQHLVFSVLGALDMGGSISIHAFGAFYGLAAALWLGKPGSGAEHPKNGAVYTSDVTAMIGTIFLFIFWPSFNGALASRPELAATSGEGGGAMYTASGAGQQFLLRDLSPASLGAAPHPTQFQVGA